MVATSTLRGNVATSGRTYPTGVDVVEGELLEVARSSLEDDVWMTKIRQGIQNKQQVGERVIRERSIPLSIAVDDTGKEIATDSDEGCATSEVNTEDVLSDQAIED